MKTVCLRCVNILLFCAGFGVLYLMSLHHTVMIYPILNPFDINYDDYGYFYSMFLIEPHIKIFYGIGALLLIGKEFFIKKKPSKFRIKINLISAAVLVIAFFAQMLLWTAYLQGEWRATELKGDFNINFAPQEIQKVIDTAAQPLLPFVSGQDKEKLLKIIKYLEDTREKAPACFEVPDNSMELLKTFIQLALVKVRIKPDDFNANVNVSKKYLDVASTIRQFKVSEEYLRLGEEYEKKGLQAAKDLIKKFPDNSLAYKYLADYFYYSSGGDRREALKLYKRCQELDERLQSCKDQFNILSKDLESASP